MTGGAVVCWPSAGPEKCFVSLRAWMDGNTDARPTRLCLAIPLTMNDDDPRTCAHAPMHSSPQLAVAGISSPDAFHYCAFLVKPTSLCPKNRSNQPVAQLPRLARQLAHDRVQLTHFRQYLHRVLEKSTITTLRTTVLL